MYLMCKYVPGTFNYSSCFKKYNYIWSVFRFMFNVHYLLNIVFCFSSLSENHIVKVTQMNYNSVFINATGWFVLKVTYYNTYIYFGQKDINKIFINHVCLYVLNGHVYQFHKFESV